MFLSELLRDFSYQFKDFDISNPLNRENAKSYLNRATRDVYRAAHWNFRKKFGQIVLIPYYQTGSCAVTQYDGTNESSSKIATFIGSSLTSNMVGRFLNFGDSENWYKIIYISGNDVYLDTPVIESTGNYSFRIWKRFYYLKSDVDVLIEFYKWQGGSSITSKNEFEINDKYARIDSVGNIENFSLVGVDNQIDYVYSDGTISGEQNQNILTGSGTNFFGNVDNGDKVIVNGLEYEVLRVESNTRIALKNNLISTVESGSSYKSKKNVPIGVEFQYVPETYTVVQYSYLDLAHSMINENYDFFPMKEEYAQAVLSRAKSLKQQDDGNPLFTTTLQIYSGELKGLKEKQGQTISRFTQFAPKVPRFMPGRN